MGEGPAEGGEAEASRATKRPRKSARPRVPRVMHPDMVPTPSEVSVSSFSCPSANLEFLQDDQVDAIGALTEAISAHGHDSALLAEAVQHHTGAFMAGFTDILQRIDEGSAERDRVFRDEIGMLSQALKQMRGEFGALAASVEQLADAVKQGSQLMAHVILEGVRAKGPANAEAVAEAEVEARNDRERERSSQEHGVAAQDESEHGDEDENGSERESESEGEDGSEGEDAE